jgi:HTH-type transcriptional regulator / antitoxin HipB
LRTVEAKDRFILFTQEFCLGHRGKPVSAEGQRRRQPYYATAARIGAKIREAREAQGLTLKQSAARIGMSFQHLSQIEHGRINTPVDTLQKIADRMGIPWDTLVIGSASPHICATLRDTEHKVRDVLQLIQALVQMLCPLS